MGKPGMMKYKVVLLPFPFDDLSSIKVRPAVCLTEPIGLHQHIILGFITSRIPVTPQPTDLIIDARDPNFSQTGLHVSSALRLHRLMTVATSLIRRELGQLSPQMQSQVNERLRQLFNL